MQEEVLRNFSMYFPSFAKNMKSYKYNPPFEITVEMNDGFMLIFNSMTNSFRRLPRNCNAMSEEECKREFGFRLQNMMGRRRITQKELSEKTGIQQCLISKYINGKSAPSFYNLDKIARALGCSTEDFRYTY